LKGTLTLTTSIFEESVKHPLNSAQTSILRQPKSVLQIILKRLEDAKAEDVVSIDLVGKTSVADFMIIATGRSCVHVGAIADQVMKEFKLARGLNPNVEGLPNCDWVLVDAGDIIVHIFRPEVRQFYNLEKMWGVHRPGEQRSELQ